MPSLTQSFPKKRRRDEQDDLNNNSDIRLTFPQDFHSYYPHPHGPHPHPHENHHGLSPRKIKPFSSPLTKKIRLAATTEWPADAEKQDLSYAALSPPPPPRQFSSPSSRHTHNNNNNNNNNRSTTTKQTSKPTTTTTNILAPCHICHRKPTKKTELDSYADCEGCGERTCYICIRACLGGNPTTTNSSVSPTTPTSTCPTARYYRQRGGQDQDLMRDGDDDEEDVNDEEDEPWGQDQDQERLDQSFTMEDAPSPDDGPTRKREEGTWGKGGGGTGHRGRICSQCCVEEGPEGEVICLGCLGT